MTKMKINFNFIAAWLIGFSIAAPATFALEVYQKPEDFVNSNFSSSIPDLHRLRLNEVLKKQIKNILGHKMRRSRLSYWKENDRTVWILEEVGKVKLITTGLVVNAGKIERVKVLKYRESRGSEVKYPFFTDQFKGAGIDEDYGLNKSIDGISGATLSVRAMKKLARVAIVLHNHVVENDLK